jgi:hypothetical protein
MPSRQEGCGCNSRILFIVIHPRDDDDLAYFQGDCIFMWIMVSGPYRSGAATEAARAANLDRMNQAALALFRMGHVPVIGVNMALPVIAAGGDYDAVMMPLSLALADRCDACLRVGGPSAGADDETERFISRGLPVYTRIEDVPQGIIAIP